MDASLGSPCKPEKADGQEDRADDARWQSCLGRGHATGRGGGDAGISLVVDNAASGSNGHTNCDADESQTTDTGAPATALLEDDRESGEAHVEGAVDNCHVDGSEKDNRLLEQKNPWARQRNLELGADGSDRLTGVELADVDLASALGELSGTTAKENGCVGLGVGQSAKNPDDTTED